MKQTMTHPYPLYDDLLAKVRERDNKNIDLKMICKTINNMSSLNPEDYSEHYREIQALIIHHWALSNKNSCSPVPFDGKIMAGRRGILNYVMNLPPILQQILAQYIELFSV